MYSLKISPVASRTLTNLATLARIRLSNTWYRLSLKQKLSIPLCCLILIILSDLLTTEIVLPPGVEINNYEPFEPEVTSEFPQGDSDEPKIPRIIHQTFQGTSIPPCFHENVRKLVKNNPNWTYYWWTDESARDFIADTHPELLATFDGYNKGLRRADFIRYVALYEFGGVYADLDTISYRSLDVAITKYSCIFPTEPFEHAGLRGFAPFLLSNAIMMCKPKHPFLKHILENLPRFEVMFHTLDATGPGFVTAMYKQYNHISQLDILYKRDPGTSNTPYFYKGELPEDDENAVYIPNTQYFCNNIDPHSPWYFYRLCRDATNKNEYEIRACVNMKVRGMVRKPNKFAILEHEFYRTYSHDRFYNYMDGYLYMFAKDIRDLVPHAKMYRSKQRDSNGLNTEERS